MQTFLSMKKDFSVNIMHAFSGVILTGMFKSMLLVHFFFLRCYFYLVFVSVMDVA